MYKWNIITWFANVCSLRTTTIYLLKLFWWWCDNEACGCRFYLPPSSLFWLYRSFHYAYTSSLENDYYYYFSHITSFTNNKDNNFCCALHIYRSCVCAFVCVSQNGKINVKWYMNVYNDGKMVRDITFMWCVWLLMLLVAHCSRVIYLMIWWICEQTCVKNGDLMMQCRREATNLYEKINISN